MPDQVVAPAPVDIAIGSNGKKARTSSAFFAVKQRKAIEIVSIQKRVCRNGLGCEAWGEYP